MAATEKINGQMSMAPASIMGRVEMVAALMFINTHRILALLTQWK